MILVNIIPSPLIFGLLGECRLKILVFAYLSPCIRWEPHFEHAKHFIWKTCSCGGAPVLITNSLAGIA